MTKESRHPPPRDRENILKKTAMPVWREDHLRLAIKAARVALWSWHVDDDWFAMDERGFELWAFHGQSE